MMHRFAFSTIGSFKNDRYALEEFPQSMAQVGGFSWTWFSEVGCETNNANCSALPCPLTSGWVGNNVLPSSERGTARNVQAAKHSNSRMEES